MLPKMTRGLIEENEKLLEENTRLNNAMSGIFKEAERLQTENYNLKGEISYLKQKVKEYRHKTWFPVYEENLKLAEDNKFLKNAYSELVSDYAKLEQELEQYKTVLSSVEKFIGQYSKEKKVGGKGCH
jgi:predicted nuclease with TOPRIM domain